MLQVGFDIGGTNIKVGVVDEDMNIISYRRTPFPTGESYQRVADVMCGLVSDMAEELSVKPSGFGSVGIAVPGQIDAERGRIVNAHNLHFHDVPMKEEMESRFPGVPVFLANDADAAALAELNAGAFRGCGTAILLTLGTGVGGGLILNGRMFGGGLGHGVEPGHMILEHGGELCTCGGRGCGDALCTATWLVRQGRKAVIEYPLSLIYKAAGGNPDRVSAKLVIDCAQKGDAIAKDIFGRYLDYLSSMIASLANLLDPEVIALGGGVSLAGSFLLEPLRTQVKQKSFFRYDYKIVPAQMGNNAGIVGAAGLYRNARG